MRVGGKTIAHAMMVYRGITLLAHIDTFIEYIQEQRQKTTDLKTWDTFKTFSHQAHREQRRVVTAAGKWGYAAEIQNIYFVQPPPPEDKHEVIDNLNIFFQGMTTHSCELEVLAQYNTVLTSSNSVVMEKLAHMTVIMKAMQA